MMVNMRMASITRNGLLGLDDRAEPRLAAQGDGDGEERIGREVLRPEGVRCRRTGAAPALRSVAIGKNFTSGSLMFSFGESPEEGDLRRRDDAGASHARETLVPFAADLYQKVPEVLDAMSRVGPRRRLAAPPRTR